ncbi:MFS general substrate transporter [Mycena floridula]|nr:MFS general substrate transporter [Mycena floridula]
MAAESDLSPPQTIADLEAAISSDATVVAPSHRDGAKPQDNYKTPGAKEKGDQDWEVRWEPDEAANPLNWSVARKTYITLVGGLRATLSSSAPSGMIPEITEHFGMSSEVSILVISLFVAGYCVGPLLWGPLSEVYGRRILFIIAFVCYTCMQVGCALAPNTAAILIFRFLSGVFSACPLTNAGSVLGDIWHANVRGKAMSVFVVAPFAGPSIGPIISGYMSVAGVHWPWLFWVICMFAGFCTIMVVVSVPETYSPVLLKWKAQRLRKETGNPYWAPLERKKSGLQHRIHDVCVKPFLMLVEEPMLLCMTLYMSFLYGILYLNFVAYPIIFQEGHGFNAGEEGLTFLSLFVGATLAAIVSVFYYNPRYIKEAAAHPAGKTPPELRLPSAQLGACLIPISMFWLAWTSYSSIHWAAPMLSGLFLGSGFIYVFMGLFNYIIDTYLYAAASALAAATVVRSFFGAGFPLFASQMYTALNPRIAGTVLGSVSLLFMPVPFLFLKYGPAIRKRSKNAANRI